LIFETQEEKETLIISYLENIFGQENFEDYQLFARYTEEKTNEKICEGYLNWRAPKNNY